MKSRLRHTAAWGIVRGGALAALAGGILPPAATAQEAGRDTAREQAPDQAPNQGLGEIIVTAQFREQALQDVPISITAVTAEELEQRSLRNVVDLAESVPNVQMTQGGSGYGSQTNQAFIRGLGQLDFLPTFEPRVGFYVDDIYYSTTFGSVFDVLDLERVEVLRGPQGTLFGRNSVGGALRLISQKPRGDNRGYAEVLAGSRDRYQLRAAFDLGLTDELAFRLVGSAKGQDGQVARLDYKCVYPQFGNALVGGPDLKSPGKGDCKLGTLGGGNSHSFRGTLAWEPVSAVQVFLSADYTKERSESPAEIIIETQSSLINPETGNLGAAIGAAGPENNGLARWLRGLGTSYYGFDVSTPAKMQEVVASFKSIGRYSTFARYGNERVGYQNPPEGEMEAYGGSLTIEADLAPTLHLTSITGYREYEGDFGQSLLGVPVEEVRNGLSHRQVSQEVRLLGEAFGDMLEYTFGAFYLDTRTLNPARVQTEGFTNALDFFSDDRATLESWALFGALDAHPIDRLTLSAGLRYSNETKSYTFDRDYSPSGLSVLNFVARGETKDDRLDPRFAITYELTDEVNLYGSYATGFTASAFNARPFGSTGIFALEPEDVTAYELGFKSSLFANTVRLNAAAFLTDFKGLVGTLQDPAIRGGACAIFCNANVGDAEIKGFEVEALARPLRDLQISASVGYTDFEYKRILARAQGLTLDSPQVRVPKWTLSGAVQYDIPLAEDQVLTPRIDASWRSEIPFSNNVANVSSVQDDYALVNLRLTWRNNPIGLSVAAAVTNLFDEYYLVSITDQRESFGFLSANVGRPREWSLVLRKDF